MACPDTNVDHCLGDAVTARDRAPGDQPGGANESISRASSTGVSPCTLWPASATCSIRAAGHRRRSSVSSASSTTDCSRIPRTSMSGTSMVDTMSQSEPNSWRGAGLAGVRAGPEPGVAPHPGTVLELHRVMQDAPPQGRLRAGRVELDGAGEEIVEAGEARRSVDERGDGAGLVLVHARGHVDEDDRPDEVRTVTGQGDGGGDLPATCRRPRPRRAPGPRWRPRRRRAFSVVRRRRRVRRRSARGSAGRSPPGSVQGHGDRVPGVRVLRAAVQEDELRWAVAPHEALTARPGSTSPVPAGRSAGRRREARTPGRSLRRRRTRRRAPGRPWRHGTASPAADQGSARLITCGVGRADRPRAA